jgi:hypothetical protein
MATIARRGSGNVGGRLARGGAGVVASGTGARRDTRVVEFGTHKSPRGVASFATQLGGHVLCVFNYIATRQREPGQVATGAIFGGSLEYAIHVAGLTTHVVVFTCERKAGLQVVKIAGVGLGEGDAAKSDQRNGQKPPGDALHSRGILSHHSSSPTLLPI